MTEMELVALGKPVVEVIISKFLCDGVDPNDVGHLILSPHPCAKDEAIINIKQSFKKYIEEL